MKTERIEITEEQADTFERLGYTIERTIYAVVPVVTKKRKGKRKSPMSPYSVLRFVELDGKNAPKGNEGEFYLKMWEEFEKVKMSDIKRDCLTKQMSARFPSLKPHSISAYISQMASIGALKVVYSDTGES